MRVCACCVLCVCACSGHEYSYSFPLIYFNVEDFEDAFSNLVINHSEYLCVELRVRLPSRESEQQDRHITIFQGAVSWDAILTTFQKQSRKLLCALWRTARAAQRAARLTLEGWTHARVCAVMCAGDKLCLFPGARGTHRVHHDAGPAVQRPLPGRGVVPRLGGSARLARPRLTQLDNFVRDLQNQIDSL